MGEVISITSRSDAPVTRPARAKLPSDIQLSIDTWRLGGCWSSVPADYVEWHFHLAGEELDRIAGRYRLEILNDPRIISDDCVRPFNVQVLTFKQRRLSLQWDDTRQAFVKHVPAGDHVNLEPLLERDLA